MHSSATRTPTMLLEASGLSVSYGRHQALVSASIQVAAGEVVVILGANGAGKTTLLSALSGVVQPLSNFSLTIDGKGMGQAPTHALVEAGLALVPDGRGIFGELSVRENLLLGAFAKRAREGGEQRLTEIFSLFPRLQERQDQMVRTMSGGEQQMVAIGRALMSRPRVLMLDEPSLGLSPLLSKEVFKTLRRIADGGVGILVVEQNARLSLAVSDRGYLLENGKISASLPASVMMNDPNIQQAYLGGQRAKASNDSAVSFESSAAPPSSTQPFAVGVVAAPAALPNNLSQMVQIAAARSEQTIAINPSPFVNGVSAHSPTPNVYTPDADFKATIDAAVQRALSREPATNRDWSEGSSRPLAGATKTTNVAAQPAPRKPLGRKTSIEIYKRNSAGELVKE
ncbi:ABC transporter ATP-binding protein [Betaproteobacteria bacterium LSUCC0117]|jgi:branched-chain amino acid transport system ATP-binding protein|nr:ABC transporter ATP-binding protein [Betaproteobacteria bacterium LSUCC0117]